MAALCPQQQALALAAQPRSQHRRSPPAAPPAPLNQLRQLPAACRHAQPPRRHAQAAAAVPAAAAAAAAAAAWQPLAAAAAQPAADLAAAVLDEAPAWTLDQAVGLVFAGLLVLLYVSSTQVDRFVARDQRRQLGLCEECGGLNEPGSCAEKNCPLRR